MSKSPSNRPKLPTVKQILLDPNTDSLKSIRSLYGTYASPSGNAHLSTVDASVRGLFSVASSIVSGTYNMAESVSGSTGNVLTSMGHKVKDKLPTKMITQIDAIKADLDPLAKYIGEVKADAKTLFKDLKDKAILFSKSEPNGSLIDFGVNLGDMGLKQAKLTSLAMAGFDFNVSSVIENAIIMDIETAGLSPNAPILQLAMLDMKRTKETSPDLNKMLSPSEQIKRGYLDLDLIPEAILRDNTRIDINGNERKPTYKATTQILHSAEEFYKAFGGWSESMAYGPKDFYKEFGDSSGVIPPQVLEQIRRELETKGYVELSGSGRRLYSQREAAKWSAIFAKQASQEDKSLIVANLPFESQRVGKLWKYFFKSGEDEFNLAFKDGHHLNTDSDIVHAFGSEIKNARDLTSMFSATWKSTYKLNIFDQNNYVYGEMLNHLRRNDMQSELIKLFPEWNKNMAKGLATKDQLDLTKMLFSGLMQTGFSPISNDVFSGAKIAWASQIVLGQEESHVAMEDAVVQGRLLRSLHPAVSNLFNVWKGQTSNNLLDHIKSFISATDIILSPEQSKWFDVADIFKNQSISFQTDSLLLEPTQLTGSAVDIQRKVSLEKEMARMVETVDSVLQPGDKENLFSAASRQGITENIPDPEAPNKTIGVRLYADGQEPFTLQQVRNFQPHTYIDSTGKEFKVRRLGHDYELDKTIKKVFADFLGQGISDSEARTKTIELLKTRYSQIQSIRNVTDESEIDEALSRVMSQSKEKRREYLNYHFGGKAGEELDTHIQRELGDSVKESVGRAPVKVEPPDLPGINRSTIKNAYAKMKDIPTRIGNIPIGVGTKRFEAGLSKVLGISEKTADWYLKTQSRNLVSLGAIGAAGAYLMSDYYVDVGAWKKTTKEILEKTGNEKEILEHAPQSRSRAGLMSMAENMSTQVDHTNNNGMALQAINSTDVDYAIGDGDTIEVLSKGLMGTGLFRHKIGSVRVAGIDTPETAHEGMANQAGEMPFARPGKNYLTNVLSARTGAQIAISDRQTFGRNVGLVTDQEGINYSYEMVSQGLGSVLFRDKPSEDIMSQSDFRRAETTAKKQETGMWADPFYMGAQSGISPLDRKGWNRLTPDNAHQFHLSKGPGTTAEQFEKMEQMAANSQSSFSNSQGNLNEINLIGYHRKQRMVTGQTEVLMSAMQPNRGRMKERR